MKRMLRTLRSYFSQDEKHSLVVQIVVELEMKSFDIFEGGYNLHVA
jgi:hypothetical protein